MNMKKNSLVLMLLMTIFILGVCSKEQQKEIIIHDTASNADFRIVQHFSKDR